MVIVTAALYSVIYAFSVLRTLSGHKSAIRCLDYHPFNDFLITGSMDTNIKVRMILNVYLLVSPCFHSLPFCNLFDRVKVYVTSVASNFKAMTPNMCHELLNDQMIFYMIDFCLLCFSYLWYLNPMAHVFLLLYPGLGLVQPNPAFKSYEPCRRTNLGSMESYYLILLVISLLPLSLG